MLGIVADLGSLDEIGGRAFPGYTARGISVTVASASGADPAGVCSRARLLGIQALVLLDYRPAERESAELAAVLTDVMRAIRPHVVVVGRDGQLVQAAQRAFKAARAAAGRTATLPAKLYIPASRGSAELSTLVPAATGSTPPSGFRRLFPDPWVTGVVEGDLFAGLTPGAGRPIELPDQQLAG